VPKIAPKRVIFTKIKQKFSE